MPLPAVLQFTIMLNFAIPIGTKLATSGIRSENTCHQLDTCLTALPFLVCFDTCRCLAHCAALNCTDVPCVSRHPLRALTQCAALNSSLKLYCKRKISGPLLG